jgi:hypothetical protein
MTKVDEYIATRIEHIKSKHSGNEAALMRRCDVLWLSMSEAEKHEAEARYIAETAPLLKERR